MSFEDLNIESINNCPGLDFSSGLRTKLYFAPAAHFLQTPQPNVGTTFESEIIVGDEAVMLPEKMLYSIDILIDENELKVNLVGAKERKRLVSNLSFFILGFRASVIGFVERCKNVPFIFFIKDANGNNWQIGNLINRAFIDSFEGTTGKKYEDNSGAMVTVSCNSKLLLYQFSLGNFLPGDFNEDFNEDFFI